jgi:predicted dehydrogenase
MRRWDSDFQLAQKLISDGEIGEPISAVCHFSGNMIHTGTHAYDVLRYFFGDAEWVEGHLEIVGNVSHHSAFQSTEQLIAHDVGGYSLIYFKNGVYATVHGDSKGFFHFEFDIMGTEGRIRIGNRLFELYQADKSKTESGLTELHRKNDLRGERKNIWTEAANNLIDCMEGKAENLSGPGDGMAALEIALAIHQSSNKGGKAVGLPLVERDFRIPSR